MTVTTTQSNFRAHINDYLDRVNDDDETVYVARPNNRVVAVISQEKLDQLERACRAKEGSLEFAVAHDQLIHQHVLPDEQVVASTDEYWSQFDQ